MFVGAPDIFGGLRCWPDFLLIQKRGRTEFLGSQEGELFISRALRGCHHYLCQGSCILSWGPESFPIGKGGDQEKL